MSSILKALKKLEYENSGPVASRSWHPGARVQPTMPVSARLVAGTLTSSVLFWSLLVTSLVLVGLIVAFIAIKPSGLSEPMPMAPAKVVSVPIATTRPVTGNQLLGAGLDIPESPADPAGVSTRADSKPSYADANPPIDSDAEVSATSAAVVAGGKTPLAAEVETPPGSDSNRLPEVDSESRAQQPVNQEPAAPSPPDLPAAPETTNPIPKFTGSTLTLQAVAWSPDPIKRMAVINDLIVREGSTIAEYTVQRITADDVLVAQGALVWRLAFVVK